MKELYVEMVTESIEDWQFPFMHFVKRGRLPNDPSKKVEIKRRATKFIVLKGLLYRASLDDILLDASQITKHIKP